MCSRDETPEFEAAVRRAFARLTDQDLPRAADERGWPLSTPEEFRTLLLGHLADGPGRRVEDAGIFDLVLAIELGERMLAGSACCERMSHRQKTSSCGRAADPDPLTAVWAAFRRPH